jgi:(2R)-sulfolactate sulfo-lyase subunit beta
MSIISKDTTFLGYRRENGRVGVRNHVIILPLDDLSNAAAEAVAHNIKGALAIPHPYGRLQFGADLELHFRTLIGAGCNPNVAAVVVIGIEDSWTQKVVDGIAATGKPVAGFGIEGHGDHDTILRASKVAREFVQNASEKRREPCGIHELWVSTKCGESDTTSGCGSNPTVGNAFDKLYETGNTLVFGETSEITGGERIVADRCRTPDVKERFHVHVQPLPGHDQPLEDGRSFRVATHQGQHRGRPHDHRGKGAGQYPEDRQEVHGGRRARQSRGTDRHAGLWFMDSSSARRPRW